MIRIGGTLTAMAVALGLVTSVHAAPVAPSSGTGTALAIMQANAALQDNDCASAIAPLTKLWNDGNLEGQDRKLAAELRLRLIACTADTAGLADAVTLSLDNIGRASSTVTAFDMHAFLLLMAQRPDMAADTLDAAMTRFPDTAPELSDLTMLGTLVQLHDTAAGRGLSLLDHAEQVHWQSHILAAAPAMGMLRLEGLRAAVAAKRDDLAALYRADLRQDAYSYITSQGDGLVSDAGAAPEPVGPILSMQIEAAKKAIVANPADLLTLSWLMTLERSAGQYEVALTQLNGILALIDQYGLQNFSNPGMYGELLADRADLLAAMGRHTEALAAYRDGAKRLVGGDFYVAYAKYLVARGDDAGAIALIDDMDVSGFDDAQKIQLVAADACAFARTGRTADYITYLSVVGNPQTRLAPRLCAGDSDGAASDLVAMINIPALRSDAIQLMQDRRAAMPASDHDAATQAALAAVKTRPEVSAAAQAAGILVRSWPIAF